MSGLVYPSLEDCAVASFLHDADCGVDVVVADVDLHRIATLSWCGRSAVSRRALAATYAGQGLDRGPGFSGDLRNLPVLGLDIGLGGEVSVDVAEFGARYFTVRGARPVLVEDIEENELLDAANRGTSGHTSIPGMLIDAPH